MSLDDEKKSSRNRQEIEDPHAPRDAQMTSYSPPRRRATGGKNERSGGDARSQNEERRSGEKIRIQL